MITVADLQAIAGSRTRSRTIQQICTAFNAYAWEYGLECKEDIALCLAHISVETGGFRRLSENMSYSAGRLMQVWPSRFKTMAQAKKYERNPQKLANYVYGGRMGNKGRPNAGWLYRGSGPGQVTGYNNFKRVQDETGLPVVDNPDILRSADSGMKATLMLWQKWGMNSYARSRDVRGSRKRWNGGYHGLKEVNAAFLRGMARDLGVKSVPIPQQRPEPPIIVPDPITLPDEVIEDPKVIEDALRDSGSRTIKETDVVEKVSLWSGFIATIKYAIDQVTDTLKDLPEWVWPVLIVLGVGFVWYRSRKIKAARVDDAMSGKNISRIDQIKAFVRNR